MNKRRKNNTMNKRTNEIDISLKWNTKYMS